MDTSQVDSAACDTEPDAADRSFADLGIDDRILQAIADVGYESPSPIQAATIPPLLDGSDVVGLAQTGTGKTAAFAIPILMGLTGAGKAPQALVLAPTRELAIQVAEAFGSYSSHLSGVHVLPIYGGQNYAVQLSGLRRGTQVVVGTPGRVIDHLERGTLDLSQLRFLVLDEADEMLKMGFQEDVEKILAQTPKQKQVALFSATMPTAIRKISRQYLRNPVEITVRARLSANTNIVQRWVSVSYQRKLDALTRILEVATFDAMIVFVRTKQATEELAEKLRARGFSAAAINGDVAQNQRERTIGQLRSGQLDILVATDVAARGLDVDRISHVVNYDIPHDVEAYVHRIGRTGRAGRSGEALLFVAPRERRLLDAIERATAQQVTEMQLPTVDDVNAQRVVRFHDTITEHLASADVALFRRLIEDYEAEHNIPLADIAAALAVSGREGEGGFFLEPDPQPQRSRRRFDDQEPDHRRQRRRAVASGESAPRHRSTGAEMATYRIAVGKRHRVVPGAIVGAIANEGGLRRSDFGNISIRPDHSLVELPAQLPQATLDALRRTRISGELIRLQLDAGPPALRSRGRARGRDQQHLPRRKPRS